MHTKYRHRTRLVYLLFLSLFLLVTAKIVYLQAFRRTFFEHLAQKQYYRLLPIEGGRGAIIDRRGRTLATGMSCFSVFADPLHVRDKKETAKLLASQLGVSEKVLLERFNRKKRFVWVKRKISWEERERIKSLDLPGIDFFREEKRIYPEEELAASAMGMVGIDNMGLEGIELSYNDFLRGKDGLVRILQDSSSRDILLFHQILTPQKGADVVLTIDSQIQYWSETYLKDTIKTWDASAGSVVVMDASSGEILALANYPGFNPNQMETVTAETVRNRAVTDMFEPGSVFKVVALLAAVHEGTYADTDTIFCENGKYKIPGSTLHDWKPYGSLSFKEVFMKSSNIGVSKIVAKLGAKAYFSFIERLELGKKTGIDLPAEVSGSVKPLKQWSKTSPYIVPIGQEIGVNLLQLVRTFACIANDGYLVRPYVIKDICSRNYCRQTQPERKRIFSTAVTERVKRILVQAVAEGTGRGAAVEGVAVGGKTGTAQKFDPQLGRYSPNRYRATFVGFTADYQPPLVIGITIDEPRKSHFGGVVAAPLFRAIAEKTIPYLASQKELVRQ